MSEAEDRVRLEVSDGVALLRLERPPMNALDADIQRRIGAAALELSERTDIAAVVLTGGDEVFAAGADIKEMAGLSYPDMVRHSSVLSDAFTAVARIPRPVVAAVNGYALGGGCELALCADIRIAAEDATFGQPEIKLGLIPGAGGTQRLARLVGPARAKELIFTGRFVRAPEALAMGLVDQVVPGPEVIPTAMAWARQFVGGPALALRAAKQSVDRGLEVDLGTGLELERTQFAGLFASEDREIGMRAFLAREAPRFLGR
jgi:enoyl-CoA hydratase/carnithine racemase